VTVDRYADFADRYDLFFGQFGEYSDQEVDFYRQLFSRHQVKSVLDCACGTGRHLALFKSLGCQVEASDFSPAMLRRAAQNLEMAGLEINLARVDYRKIEEHFTNKFDAVVCLSSAIDEMPDQVNALQAFRSMRSALNPDGILVLTQGTSDRQWNTRPRFIPAINRVDFSRLFVIDYFEKSADYTILDLVHTQDKSEFKAWTMHYNLILLRDDMDFLLKTAGFRVVEFWGDFDFSTYDKTTSQRLIAVARH
jgi:glycine/sarcosine N-methyltransferase